MTDQAERSGSNGVAVGHVSKVAEAYLERWAHVRLPPSRQLARDRSEALVAIASVPQ